MRIGKLPLLALTTLLPLYLHPGLHLSLHAQVDDQRARQMIDDAGGHLANSRFQQALQTLAPLTKDEAARKANPRAAYMAGIAHYMLNDYEKAASFLKDRQGLREADQEVAAFHYGAAAYALRQHDQAIEALTPLVQKKPDDILNIELRPYAILTLARSVIGKAEALAKDNPSAAKAEAAKAIPFIDQLNAEDKEGLLADEASTVKAIAYALSDQLVKAEELLQSLMAREGSQLSQAEVNNMLAYILSKRYRQLLTEFKEDEAAEVMTKTKAIYSQLLESDDMAIVNQAAFELANLELASGNPEAAFKAFRAIRSKSDIIAALQIKLDRAQNELQSARGDVKAVTAAQKEVRKLQQKLQDIQGRPDLALDALIRTADTYLQMGSYDEARTIYRYVMPFLEAERKAGVEGQVIVTLALQGLVDQAEAQFQTFKQANPDNSVTQSVPFLIGIALLQQEKYQEAIDQFERNMKEYPNSSVNDQIPSRIATAYRGLAPKAKTKEEVDKYMNLAAQALRDFIKNANDGKIKVPKASIEDAQLQLAQTLAGQNNNDEALKILDELTASASTSEIKQSAAFTRAGLLEKLKKTDEAVAAYKAFASDFPNSDKADDSAYKAAIILEAAGQQDQARAAYDTFIADYADSPLVDAAYTQIWKTYKAEQNYAKMVEAQDRLIQARPQSGAAIGALFDRAKTFSGAQDPALRVQAPDIINQMIDKIIGFKGTIPDAQYETFTQYANYGLVLLADIKRTQIQELGANYTDIEAEADKEKYAALHSEVIELMKRALEQFPHPGMLTFNFSRLQESMVKRVEIGKGSTESYADVFSELAGKARTEEVKAQALLNRADIYYNTGRATESAPLYDLAFKEVKNPAAISALQYERYGSQLIEQKKWEELAKIAAQLESAWGGNSRKKIADIANSTALFFKAKVAESQGDNAEAGKFYQQIKDQYPNTPKATEVDFGLALNKIRGGQFDEGIAALSDLTRSPLAPLELKARALIEIALALEKVADAGQTSKFAVQGGTKVPELDVAVNNLQRVEVHFPDMKNIAAEALYLAVGIRKKQGKTQEAEEIRLNLITNYSTTEWAGKLR